MRKFLFTLLCLFLTPAFCTEEVAMLNGALRFLVPEGYTQLTREESAEKFGRPNRPPLAVFGDAAREATIAFTLVPRPQPVGESSLPAVKAELEQMLPRAVPGLQWHERRLLEMNGRFWIHFELGSRAKEAELRNAMYFTAWQGQILGINAVAPAAAWPVVEPAMRQAVESVQIGDPVVGGIGP